MTMFISEAVLEAKPSGTFQDNTGTFWWWAEAGDVIKNVDVDPVENKLAQCKHICLYRVWTSNTANPSTDAPQHLFDFEGV